MIRDSVQLTNRVHGLAFDHLSKKMHPRRGVGFDSEILHPV